MKRLLFLTLCLAGFGLMSCKKCQTCTVNVTQNVLGFEQNVSANSTEYCGDEYDNAPAEGTYSQDVGGVQQTVTTTCEDS